MCYSKPIFSQVSQVRWFPLALTGFFLFPFISPYFILRLGPSLFFLSFIVFGPARYRSIYLSLLLYLAVAEGLSALPFLWGADEVRDD